MAVSFRLKGKSSPRGPRGRFIGGQIHELFSYKRHLATLFYYPCIGAVLPALGRLPAEVSLVRTTPTLPAFQVQQQSDKPTGMEQDHIPPTTSSIIVADGIPPIPLKISEKIRRWEFVDLASLLANDTPSDCVTTVVVNGQSLTVPSSVNPTKKRRISLDIHSWSQAFSLYAAVLMSADSTTKAESAGLMAHMFSVLQIAKDLGGSQWLNYDRTFREWAAAKNIRCWGELNMPIFCQCLAIQQRSVPSAQPSEFGSKGGSGSAPGRQCCRKWNFMKESCKRAGCKFSHCCYYCGGPHKGSDCPSRVKKNSDRYY